MIKDLLKGIVVTIAGVAIFALCLFGGGKLFNAFDRTIGKESVSIQREKFKESKSYIEGMVNSLSEYKREYDRAETEDEKKQVLTIIDIKFSNFDANLIENNTLYKFLIDVREGRL